MKNIISTAALFALGTTAAHAGGIDRSGQGIGVLFEEGNALTYSIGVVDPTVSSSPAAFAGDVANSYIQLGFGIKQSINENVDIALVYDQPFGANITYSEGGLTGTDAVLSSGAFTGLVRYKTTSGFSAHAGLRVQTMTGTVAVPAVLGYSLETNSSMGFGYVAGVAYERPDIALRVALTYNSAISHTFDTTEFGALPGTMDASTPQSVNLDFQTGVAANTLVFGSVRWVNWSEFAITPATYPLGSLVEYDNDVFTYSLGVGRKFSDTFSGALTLGYEAAQGGLASNLSPTDGNFSVGLGGTYTMGSSKITGGVRFINIGDTTTTAGIPFADNTAIAFGLSVTQSF